ncbi:response regulator [Mesorhizobium atlanticum]|uniref:Response regulator n=1 Tax=Mesorhizobium atlanticum TaxID=2233532 RepID=A0A330GN01_9HYPH|nr:response regulator [Mesorhizobium atlanticum]RAZ72375.1 response regulator [Mesorhizobium atlanticum]
MNATSLQDRAILIVEDEFLIALEASEILEASGATVIGPAYRLDEAMTLVESNRVDLALLDVNLNGELSDPVVAALQLKGVPVALTTGYGNKLPFTFLGPVLTKPYTPDELVAVMGAL